MPVNHEPTNETKPRFQTVGDQFVVQSSTGELWLPLRFKTKLFRAVVGKDEMVAFLGIIENLGDAEVLNALDEQDLTETAEISAAWFQAVALKLGATTPGESESSSN